ncbi:MAG TPA: DUF4011 domain-containing protein [Petrotogaceae bacterium]|nr:DUF4011 domain-containing protein [Petrotogaceae bacterium]
MLFLEEKIKSAYNNLYEFIRNSNLIDFKTDSTSYLEFFTDNIKFSSNGFKSRKEFEINFEKTPADNIQLFFKDEKTFYIRSDEKDKKLVLEHILSDNAFSKKSTGISILYLSYGTLKWKNHVFSQKHLFSPVFLMPISVLRKNENQYLLKIHSEQFIFNPFLKDSLVDMLDCSLLDNHAESFFKDMPEKIPIDWEINQRLFLSLFNIERYMNFKELENRKERLLSLSIVKTLYSSDEKSYTTVEKEKIYRPMKILPVSILDKSQQNAVKLYKKNNDNYAVFSSSFSEKNEVTVNIILQALAEQKNVLYVYSQEQSASQLKKALKERYLDNIYISPEQTSGKNTDTLKKILTSLDSLGISTRKSDTSTIEDDLISQYEKSENILSEYYITLNTFLGKTGLKVSEVFERYLVFTFKRNPTYRIPNVKSMSIESFSENQSILNEFSLYSDIYKIYNDHPLRELCLKHFEDVSAVDSLKPLFTEYLKYLNFIDSYIKKLIPESKNTIDSSYIDSFIEILRLLKELELIDLTIKTLFTKSRETLLTFCEKLKFFCDSYELARKRFTEEIFFSIPETELMLEHYIANKDKQFRNFLPQFSIAKKYFIKNLRAPSDKPNIDVFISDLHRTFSERQELLADSDFTNIVGAYLKNSRPNITILKKIVDDLRSILNLIDTSKIPFYIVQNYEQVTDSEINYLKTDFSAFKKIIPSVHCPDSLISQKIELTEKIVNNSFMIVQWFEFTKWLEKLTGKELNAFLDYFCSENFDISVISEVYEETFLLSCIENIFINFPVLRNCDPKYFSDISKKYRVYSEQYVEKNLYDFTGKYKNKSIEPEKILELRKLLFSNIQDISSADLKKIINDNFNIIKEIVPLVILPILSVPDYFFMAEEIFDLIIIDDASTIYSEDVLPLFLKGKRFILAGDIGASSPSKASLSTDNFFNMRSFETDIKDNFSKNILELARESDMPAAKLTRSYNRLYNRLTTLMADNLYNREIVFYPDIPKTTEGLYLSLVEKNDPHIEDKNFNEAMQVINLINEYRKRFPKYTIGVVTLNSQQKDLIYSVLKDIDASEPIAKSILGLIKDDIVSIEDHSVLLNEKKDIIIFSTVVSSSTLFSNIEKLSAYDLLEEKKRFNTIVSCATHLLHLVTSIDSQSFEKLKTFPQCVFFYNFFSAFFTRESSLDFSESSQRKENLFLDFLCIKLSNEGHQCFIRNDSSEKFIQFKNSESIIIEYDFEIARTCLNGNERECLRNSYFEQNNIKPYRIWLIDWVKDFAKQYKELIKFIETAETHTFVSTNRKKRQSFAAIDKEDICSSIQSILALSSLSEKEIKREVIKKFGFSRLTKEMSSLIETYIQELLQKEIICFSKEDNSYSINITDKSQSLQES